jgi:hypothetical protein
VTLSSLLVSATQEALAVEDDLDRLRARNLDLEQQITELKAEIDRLKGELEPPAPSYRDIIGVATHLHYAGKPSAASPAMTALIGDLGVKHIRDGWGIGYPPTPDPCDAYMLDLHQRFGVKITFVCDPRDGNDLTARVAHLRKLAGLGLLDAIEGPNEPGGYSGTDTAFTAARDWTKRLVAAVRADRAFDGIPLLAPSLANTIDTAQYQRMGLIAGLDCGNTHPYPGNAIFSGSTLKPMDQVVAALDTIAVKAVANARIIAGADKPVICTETNTTTIATSYPKVTEQQQADLLEHIVSSHQKAGITRTFFYQLAPAGTDWRVGLALVRADLTPKPAYTKLKQLLAS